jgi:hypothetical protein
MRKEFNHANWNSKIENVVIERLSILRDIFIFSCYTGIAYVE